MLTLNGSPLIKKYNINKIEKPIILINEKKKIKCINKSKQIIIIYQIFYKTIVRRYNKHFKYLVW